jgi:MFS family permease
MSNTSLSEAFSGSLLRLTVALFLSYLSVAMALPVTSLYVHQHFGLGSALGGLAVGIAFLATLLTRPHAGRLTDTRGGKQCLRRGLLTYTAGALLGLGTLAMPGVAGYVVLLASRLLLGLGESLAIVGVISWGMGLLDPTRAGRVLAMIGVALYGAFAVGGPLGLWLYRVGGYGALMLACALLPLAGLALMAGLPAVAPAGGQREAFVRVVGRIKAPGCAVALQGVGFAALGAFAPAYFLASGWPHAGLALTCFGLGFVFMRLAAGHLPDRIGGVPVALASLLVEALGQALLWLAQGPYWALAGALLTGLGCSMVFPAMGLEAVKRVPPHMRGTAMGAFAAFQDLAYGATGPLTGLLADRAGYPVVFLIGALCAALGVLVVVGMRLTAATPASAYRG